MTGVARGRNKFGRPINFARTGEVSVWGASSGKASFQADTALQAVERSNDLAFGKAIERIMSVFRTWLMSEEFEDRPTLSFFSQVFPPKIYPPLKKVVALLELELSLREKCQSGGRLLGRRPFRLTQLCRQLNEAMTWPSEKQSSGS